MEKMVFTPRTRRTFSYISISSCATSGDRGFHATTLDFLASSLASSAYAWSATTDHPQLAQPQTRVPSRKLLPPPGMDVYVSRSAQCLPLRPSRATSRRAQQPDHSVDTAAAHTGGLLQQFSCHDSRIGGIDGYMAHNQSQLLVACHPALRGSMSRHLAKMRCLVPKGSLETYRCGHR
jgi:hypothetical protein